MRYHILASDYDGTIAHNERVSEATLAKLQKVKSSNRKLVLVTGREMPDLQRVFPDYKVFDYLVVENGAVLIDVATGKQELLGPAPDPAFVNALREKGVAPMSVGDVIIATWEPHQHTVLEVIKQFGIERQVIFNKGAVMILPPGINKATGLQTLLQSQCFSLHNTVAVGDAENDTAMLGVAECSVAVSNALPALKETVDFVTKSDHGHGVMELIDELISDDLAMVDVKLQRHYLHLGTTLKNEPFAISPYHTGILLSGVSGGGKTTLTVSLAESLTKNNYQFVLIDPEGDYLELPNAVIVGDEKKLPGIDELEMLLKNPLQSLVICLLSVPVTDRPQFFSSFLTALVKLRNDYGHPHWLLADEAHHLLPAGVDHSQFGELNNFVLISTSPKEMSHFFMSKIGMLISVGDNSAYAFEQFCNVTNKPLPVKIPELKQGEACIWDLENNTDPFVININPPRQLMQRHKKKYATGDMGENSLIFTGREGKLRLKATNLMMFVHLAEGIDDDTWLYHLRKGDYSKWFRDYVHDDELADLAAKAEKETDASASKKMILDFINLKYTG